MNKFLDTVDAIFMGAICSVFTFGGLMSVEFFFLPPTTRAFGILNVISLFIGVFLLLIDMRIAQFCVDEC